MTSRATKRFWKCYESLPERIQILAQKNYRLWLDNPQHPSLDFKKLCGSEDHFSVRVGDHYRAIGRKVVDGVDWVWIGSHEDYNGLTSGRNR